MQEQHSPKPILIIGPNPAHDLTFQVQELTPGANHLLRPLASEYAGKAWNAALLAARLGLEVTYLSFNFRSLIEIPHEKGLTADLVAAEEALRQNWKIRDSSGAVTELNQQGGPVSEAERSALLARHQQLMEDVSSVLWCGSLPQGFQPEDLAAMVRTSGEARLDIMLDVSGEALQHGLAAGARFIKPNLSELSMIIGRRLTGLKEAKEEALRLLEKHRHLQAVAVSAGTEGNLYVDREEALFAPALDVPARGVIGAGDSMMAGFAFARVHVLPPEEALRLAVACASASVQLEGTAPASAKDARKLLDRVHVERV